MDSVAQRLSVVGAGTALELRGVTRLFGALAALTDVTITVRPGERRAVLGSNGAGKTTLFNCITGDFLPSSGTIRFFGEDITHFPPYERIQRGLRRKLIEILTALPAHIGYIIIEHDRDVALGVVEGVRMMHNGRIFKEGPPQEIESDPEVQELYLGGGHE